MLEHHRRGEKTVQQHYAKGGKWMFKLAEAKCHRTMQHREKRLDHPLGECR